jgi:hypothetical protein
MQSCFDYIPDVPLITIAFASTSVTTIALVDDLTLWRWAMTWLKTTIFSRTAIVS